MPCRSHESPERVDGGSRVVDGGARAHSFPRDARPRAASWALAALIAALAIVPVAAHAATRLTGRVIDTETQKPIAGALVELANASGGPGFYRDRTSGAGEFALANIVPDRSYTLSVSADGYADFVLGYWQIPSAQQSAGVVIPLDRAGSIAVRLTRGDGKTPVPGGKVTVRSESPSPWWRATRDEPGVAFTDKQGRARFPDLRTGPWTVQSEAAGLLSGEARRVSVRRGQETAIALELFRPASLAGVVRLADGTPVADVTVMARGPAEGVGTTGPEGDFAIGDLPPGKYRVEVQHDGFEPTRGREPLDLAEGQARGGIELTATPRAPELSFVLPREVFTPDDKIEVAMRSFRLGVLDLALYRIPVASLLDGARDFRRYAQPGDTTGLERARSWTHTSGDGPPFAWREEMLRIGQDLEPGAYVLRATAPGVERRQIFFVSDLSLLVKRSASRLLVSAASFKTGVPVERAAVSWMRVPASQRGRPVNQWTNLLGGAATAAGATNDDGLLMAPLTGVTEAVRVIAVSEGHGVAIAEAPLASPVEQGGDQVYLYTERPIYRPGQTVFWKAFARRARGSGYAIPDASDVRLTLTGPEGATVDVPDTTLSERGSADGSIALPADLPMGEYTLQAHAARAVGSATFAIEAYRKPEFRVDVTPDREVVASGDEVRFQVAASYFFGAPVFGALVRYNLFETRLARDDRDFDEEGWEGGDRLDSGFGRVLKTGETRTDIDGKVSLVFTPERVAYDRRLTLEVEVLDASNRSVRGRGSAIVGRGAFVVSARPENRLVIAGQPVVVMVATRDHLGKPVSAAVTVTLDQDAWNPIERRFTRSTRPLASATVTTDASGRARVSLTPEPARSGNLTIRARAEDAKGNVIGDETSVWVYDARTWQYAYRYPSLEAFADHERYQPGDSARIVINTDAGYSAVLATLEGREIEDVKIVHLFGNTGMVTFPIRAEHAPNVYVSIHVRKGKEIVTRVLDLAVSGERHDLAIALTPDRASYRPRDEARVKIETRDGQGTPASAEVSLGVVDEAIYQLRADNTPKPHEVFYGHRPNWVATVVAFPAVYLGGASKGERDEVRRDFRDVAFWAPAVMTDANGRAEVSFRFPDNLTTWRLTSRGATADTKVGETVAKTLVTKDLVARLAPPRALVAGDQVGLLSVVTNRSQAAQPELEESIQAEGAATITGDKSRRSSVPPGGESLQEWRLEAARDLSRADPDSVAAVITFRARGANDRDALEARVPVRPRAVPTRWTGAGVVDGDRQEIVVPLPGDLVRTGSEIRIDLSASPAAMALAAANALAEYPWGCTEQTANFVRPAVALLEALADGAKPPGWENPERRLAAPLARLVALQTQEGGWGWWPENDMDPYMTALAVDALARAAARDLGGESVRASLQRAQYPAIRAAMEARTIDGQAYVLAHLVPSIPFFEPGETQEPGKAAEPSGARGASSIRPLKRPAIRRSAANASELRQRLEELATLVHAQRERLSVAGLALAARAMRDLGRDAEAKTLLGALMSKAQHDGGGLHLPAAMDESDWFGEAEENTGYALSALLAIDARDGRAGEMVQWLARRRTGRLWRSTRTTGPVAIALAEYLATRPGETRPEFRLAVQWNGETVLDRAITPADAFSKAIQVRLGGRVLKPGENRMTITRRGAGRVYVAWEATAMVPSPGPASPGAPLTVTRAYLKAERTTDRRGRPQYLASPLESGAELAVGDLVMVRLTLDAKRAVDYLMIEDPRPAGFEIDALRPEGVERPWNAHAEERDQGVAFFLDRVEAGQTVIEYLYRPERGIL